jgi:sarcosine oxidase gamma subunit
MKYSNAEIETMIHSARELGGCKGLLGHVLAYNVRRLTEAAQEYLSAKDEALIKYGTEQADQQGNPTGWYVIDKEAHPDIVDELAALGAVEHDVDVSKIKYMEAIETKAGESLLDLTCEQQLSIAWMLED